MRRKSIHFVAFLFALLGAVLAMGCAGGPTSPSGGSIPPPIPITETKVSIAAVVPEAPSGTIFTAGVDAVTATVSWALLDSDRNRTIQPLMWVCLGLEPDTYLPASCHGEGVGVSSTGTINVSHVTLSTSTTYASVSRTNYVHACFLTQPIPESVTAGLDRETMLHFSMQRIAPFLLGSCATVERVINWVRR